MASKTDWRGTWFGIGAGAVVAGVGLMFPIQIVSAALVIGGVTVMVTSVAHRLLRPVATLLVGCLVVVSLGCAAAVFRDRLWPASEGHDNDHFSRFQFAEANFVDHFDQLGRLGLNIHYVNTGDLAFVTLSTIRGYLLAARPLERGEQNDLVDQIRNDKSNRHERYGDSEIAPGASKFFTIDIANGAQTLSDIATQRGTLYVYFEVVYRDVRPSAPVVRVVERCMSFIPGGAWQDCVDHNKAYVR